MIRHELDSSLKVVVANTVTVPGKPADGGTPVSHYPGDVTLSGDPTARQAGLEKLTEELYPTIVQRTTGQMTQWT